MRKKILFIVLFALVGFGAMKVPFSQLVGAENLRFSLFDFYGPIAGAFVGSVWGLVTVGLMQLINWTFAGFPVDTGTILRFFPVLFGVLYFAKHQKWTLAIPVLAMIAFWAHPESRAAWYFALYWTIPLIMYPFHKKFIFARALGTTFTQHAVGGALWVWVFNMKAALWIGLIPVVWKERMLMAIGITITYIVFNYLFSLVQVKTSFKLPFVTLHPRFVVRTK
ncbi:MAG: hypothetical protein WC862_00445 [Patescibacteria group bacterium]